MKHCAHSSVTNGQHFSYSGGVYTPGVTHENKSASGCVTYTQTCNECGATREVNQNGHHFEFGAYSSGSLV